MAKTGKNNPLTFLTKGISGIFNFFKDSVDELRKVIWLSPKEVAKFTTYVLAFLIGTALFIAFLDYVFTKAITFITTT